VLYREKNTKNMKMVNLILAVGSDGEWVENYLLRLERSKLK
jgi:hypothetical protein